MQITDSVSREEPAAQSTPCASRTSPASPPGEPPSSEEASSAPALLAATNTPPCVSPLHTPRVHTHIHTSPHPQGRKLSDFFLTKLKFQKLLTNKAVTPTEASEEKQEKGPWQGWWAQTTAPPCPGQEKTFLSEDSSFGKLPFLCICTWKQLLAAC